MRSLLIQIVIGIAAVWLADEFIEKVELAEGIQNLLIVGSMLGLINFFVRPILNLIAFPLRLLTLGVFGILINILLIWAVDILMVDKLDIIGIIPLFQVTILVWGLSIVVPLLIPKKKPKPITTGIPNN